MDPNACLAEIRALLAKRADHEHQFLGYADCQRLADLVEALDGWLSKGGCTPDAWLTQLTMRLIEKNDPGDVLMAVTRITAPFGDGIMLLLTYASGDTAGLSCVDMAKQDDVQSWLDAIESRHRSGGDYNEGEKRG